MSCQSSVLIEVLSSVSLQIWYALVTAHLDDTIDALIRDNKPGPCESDYHLLFSN